MVFAAPLWLIALFPWAGAVLWLLWGRRRRTLVPFLELWRGPALQKPARRALQPPPIFLAFAIIAMGLALLSAARPTLDIAREKPGRPITLIVDRGITMSAMSGSVPRFMLTARRVAEELNPLVAAATSVDLIVLPGEGAQQTRRGAWLATVEQLPIAAIDTQAALESAVRDQLMNSAGAVVVISDRKLEFDDPRLIQFAPEAPFQNVGIVRIAARETPSPQVMVRLRNDADRHTITLNLSGMGNPTQKAVELPPRGQERNYFLDADRLDAVIEVSLDGKDDQPADDRAWLVREGSFAKIEARAPLSLELRRMVDVYARSRPAREDSAVVAIVGDEKDLPSETPTVIVAPATGARVHGEISTKPDPITANIDWPRFSADVRVAGDVPKGWTPLVSIADHVLVAVRTEPVRRVWVGFDAAGWSGSSDFVVFWANVFTWAGHGQERFASHPLTGPDGAWKPVEQPTIKPTPLAGFWPGIYHATDGSLRAYNASVVPRDHFATTTADWKQRFESAEEAGPAGQRGYNISPVLVVLAVACIAGAAMSWKKRGLTPVSAGRTF